MKTVYFTVTGMNFHFGTEFVERGMTVRLIKEPDNKYDNEAIRVEMEGLGKVGYVANSTGTVLGESMSAGRLYDRIGDAAEGTILYKFEKAMVCTVNEDSIIYTPPCDETEDDIESECDL